MEDTILSGKIFRFIISSKDFISLAVKSRLKTVQAGELDCPQDNQKLQATTDFETEIVLSLVIYAVGNNYFSTRLILLPSKKPSNNIASLTELAESLKKRIDASICSI